MATDNSYRGEPQDEVERAAQAFSQAVIDNTDRRAIILVDTPKDGNPKKGVGSSAYFGYDKPQDALQTLLSHADNLAKSMGMEMQVMSVGDVNPRAN